MQDRTRALITAIICAVVVGCGKTSTTTSPGSDGRRSPASEVTATEDVTQPVAGQASDAMSSRTGAGSGGAATAAGTAPTATSSTNTTPPANSEPMSASMTHQPAGPTAGNDDADRASLKGTTNASAQGVTGPAGEPGQRQGVSAIGSELNDKEDGGFDTVVLSFNTGANTLGSAETERLRAMINNLGSRRQIQRAEIVAWSDKLISSDVPSLSATDRQLAEKRIDAVRGLLRQKLGGQATVNAHNMADANNWIARNINSSEAELQSAFAKKQPGSLRKQDLDIIKRQGGPSKAIVIFGLGKKIPM